MSGKSQKPRCFAHSKRNPNNYTLNSRAWMTDDIFKTLLLSIDGVWVLKKRHIDLVIDNCPEHVTDDGLTNTTLYFLPPGTTSTTQPMDMGVIANFKYYYRTEIIKRYLVDMDNSMPTDIDVLTAYDHIIKAWENVKMSTIINCFKKFIFLQNNKPDDRLVQSIVQ